MHSSTILSPISLSIALAMVYLGAGGNTSTQIQNVLAKDASEDEIHSYFSKSLDYINSYEYVTLKSVNRVYVQNDYKLLESYDDGIQKYYSGEFELIDFTQSLKAANKINEFVSNSTNNKIKKVVSPDFFNSLTRMFLINTVYFKGDWQMFFQTSREANFYLLPEKNLFTPKFEFTKHKNAGTCPEGKKKKLQMMHRQMRALYYENDDFEIVGISFWGEQTKMFILLPRERYGLENLLNSIKGSDIIQILSKMESTILNIYLPKFKIESSLDVKDSFKKLGIIDAFSSYANFSGIFENIKVSDIQQKAFIEVNEDGVEAAAVTTFKIIECSGCSRCGHFRADHPFMFILADNKYNILFTGTFLG